MTGPEARTPLVLGLGNVLLGDEGLGVRALERLQACGGLPDTVRALDGGVMGLDLLPYLYEASDLLILDAVRTGKQPGALVRLVGPAIHAALSLKMSMHQVGLQELLATASLQGSLPGRVVLLGMEPESLAPGLELSPLVAGRLDRLAGLAVAELRRWGIARIAA